MLKPATTQTDAHPAQPENVRCVFEHPMFSKLGDVAFRLSEVDCTPVLVIPMGDVTAALPLGSLKQEAGIKDDSPDGRMLAQVAKALDFVGELRPGDPLPAELLGGAASWLPGSVHQDTARARITLQLTALFDDAAGPDIPAASAAWASADRQRALAAAKAPGMTLQVHAATIKLVARLSLPDMAAATQLLDAAVHEMSFVDALRARLLARVTRLYERLELFIQNLTNNQSRLELIKRVRRLVEIGLNRIRARFEALNEQVADLLGLLRDIEARRPVIHRHRDWLYCSLRAWEGVLSSWDSASPAWADSTLPLLGQTYRFLAPRFMPMQEWLLTARARRPEEAGPTRMVW